MRLFIMLAIILLSGCGQTGKLYLPVEDTTPEYQSETSAEASSETPDKAKKTEAETEA